MALALELGGRVALVTGGSRGIGAATVRLLAEAGASVMFNFQKSSEAAVRLVLTCGKDRTACVQSDLIGEGAEEMLVEQTVTRFGHIDILVVNHGVWPAADRPVDQLSDEQWRSTMAINLDSAFLLVKAAVREMKRTRRGGDIVMVSSTAAQRGEAFHCDYAATKGAIISMVKGLSTELAPDGIRVNCVAPGWVATDMSAPVMADPATRQRIHQTIPLGRIATPEEIAGPIVFLCTPLAGFITGEVFNVNGGAVLVG
jgi:3-oxoacyl-[acyl-carrier protein] reductase